MPGFPRGAARASPRLTRTSRTRSTKAPRPCSSDLQQSRNQPAGRAKALTPACSTMAFEALPAAYDPTTAASAARRNFRSRWHLEFLLRYYQRTARQRSRWTMVEHTLGKMAHGGIYDQLGGGFHRYSVDAQWLVPHFEKMLYDNAQLLRIYSQATDHPRTTLQIVSSKRARATCCAKCITRGGFLFHPGRR